MPELPEVETVRRGLKDLIVGKKVKSAVDVESPKSFPNSPNDIQAFLVGASIVDVRRRAKVLMIDLDSGYTLVIHLKMTGQLVYVGSGVQPLSLRHARSRHGESDAASLQPVKLATLRQSSAGQEPTPDSPGLTRNDDKAIGLNTDHGEGEGELRFGAGHPTDSLVGSLPDRSTRVIIEFTDDSHLYFNDQRRFGWVRLFPTVEVPNIKFMQTVGPEPLEDDFTANILYQRLQRRKNTTIKAAILDQTVLAGVGNIYADEGLWGAKIHPSTRVKDVPKEQVDDLWRELREVMTLSIEKGGSTDRNYVDAEGRRGSYMDFARVFRREGKPCLRHPDVLIEKIRVAGRGTHVCPVCQVDVGS